MTTFVYLVKRLAQETQIDVRSEGFRAKALIFATTAAVFMIMVTGASSGQNKTEEVTFFNVESSSPAETEEASVHEVPAQIVNTDSQIRKYSTVEYVAQEVKTVSSVARKFSVSNDTIRWANSITGDEIKAGQAIKVPPVSGLEYKIQKGDSVESIAAYYSADPDEVASFNGIVVRSLKPGEVLFIPDGEKPVPPRWSSDPSGHDTVTISRSRTPTYSGNGYPWGNCTWYVSNRRAELGRPMPNKLGNARSWAYTAASAGFKVDHNPLIGAVMAESRTNHVAIVERINPDGSITISEMNYNWRLGVKSFRTIPPTSVSKHSYIH